MVRIHHLAWVDNLDAGAIVLVQRHEDWVVATADSSKYPPADSRTDPSRTNLGYYMMDLERLKGSPGVDSRVKEQYGRSNRIIQAKGHAGRCLVVEKQAVAERRIDY